MRGLLSHFSTLVGAGAGGLLGELVPNAEPTTGAVLGALVVLGLKIDAKVRDVVTQGDRHDAELRAVTDRLARLEDRVRP